MKMRKLFIFLPLLLFFTPCVFCQKSLQISFTRFGKIKTHEVYVGDRIHYKLISESRFRKNRITHLQDSLIFFENDSSIVLRKIRRLRFRKEAL